MDARSAAVRILLSVLQDGRSLTDALDAVSLPSGPDNALARELAYGVLRWYERLDALARLLLAKPLKAKDREIHLLVLVGLYQLLEMRVPPHAAVSATAEVARRTGRPWAVGLVNAVLRRFQREREQLLARLPQTPEVTYAYPRWLVERIRRAWPAHWQRVLEAGNQRPPMVLRVNRRRIDRDAYRDMLTAAGIAAEPLALAEDALQLAEPLPVERLPGFADGLVSVQDAAAQLAAPLLAPPPGARVLDACAAPGGKTCHLLERYPELAELVVLDVDPARLRRVRDNLQRLGLTATVVAGDAGAPADWWDGRPFERILLDAPCSGTGVIRRHPDIKRLRREQDLEVLGRTQRRLLEAVWSLLAPGGKLIYSTCSILPQENEDVLADFLARHPEARVEPITAQAWGERLAVGRQILTGDRGMDGFYYGCLSKQ